MPLKKSQGIKDDSKIGQSTSDEAMDSVYGGAITEPLTRGRSYTVDSVEIPPNILTGQITEEPPLKLSTSQTRDRSVSEAPKLPPGAQQLFGSGVQVVLKKTTGPATKSAINPTTTKPLPKQPRRIVREAPKEPPKVETPKVEPPKVEPPKVEKIEVVASKDEVVTSEE